MDFFKMYNICNFLVDFVITPAGVEPRKRGGHAVVLAHEQRVEDDQVELFVDPEVAGKEAVRFPAPAYVTSGYLNNINLIYII
jgi:hypothetical protein